jgi:hypothetical protein
MSDQTDMDKGFLKEKLGNYLADPPEKVWDSISAQIDNGSKRRGMYILLLATAASIALAITLGIHFFGPDLPQEQSRMEEPRVEEAAPEMAIQEEAQLAVTIQQTEREEADTPALPEKEQNPVPDPIDNLETLIVADLAKEADLTKEAEVANEADAVVDPEPTSDPMVLLLADTADELSTDPFLIIEQDKHRDPRWMVGAAVSPLYSYRDAEAVSMPSNQAESGMLSYSTGVQVSYRRNSRLSFETGIYYNKTGIAIGAPGIKVFSQRRDAMIFGVGSEQADINTVSNSVGNIVAYSGDIYMNGYKISAENNADAMAYDVLTDVQASESGIQQHLDFLELPFNLRYSVIDRTIELQLVGGMSTNFLVGNSVTVEGPSGREEIGYLSNVNTVNYSGNAGLGMIYHVGKKLNLLFEPRFRYFLNSVNDASLPSTRPYSLAFYTGLSYTF